MHFQIHAENGNIFHKHKILGTNYKHSSQKPARFIRCSRPKEMTVSTPPTLSNSKKALREKILNTTDALANLASDIAADQSADANLTSTNERLTAHIKQISKQNSTVKNIIYGKKLQNNKYKERSSHSVSNQTPMPTKIL